MSFSKWKDCILEIRISRFNAGEVVDDGYEFSLNSNFYCYVEPDTRRVYIEEHPEAVSLREEEHEAYEAVSGKQYTGFKEKYDPKNPKLRTIATATKEVWGIQYDSVKCGHNSSLMTYLIEDGDGILGIIATDHDKKWNSLLDTGILKDIQEAFANADAKLKPEDFDSVSILYLVKGWASESWTDCGTEYDNGIELHKMTLDDIVLKDDMAKQDEKFNVLDSLDVIKKEAAES